MNWWRSQLNALAQLMNKFTDCMEAKVFFAKFTKAYFRTLPWISSLQSSPSIISCIYIPSVVWSLKWHSFQIVTQLFVSFASFPLVYSVHLTVRCSNLLRGVWSSHEVGEEGPWCAKEGPAEAACHSPHASSNSAVPDWQGVCRRSDQDVTWVPVRQESVCALSWCLHVHNSLLRSVVLYCQQCKCKVMSSTKDSLEWRGKWNIYLLVHIFSQALAPLVLLYFPPWTL